MLSATARLASHARGGVALSASAELSTEIRSLY